MEEEPKKDQWRLDGYDCDSSEEDDLVQEQSKVDEPEAAQSSDIAPQLPNNNLNDAVIAVPAVRMTFENAYRPLIFTEDHAQLRPHILPHDATMSELLGSYKPVPIERIVREMQLIYSDLDFKLNTKENESKPPTFTTLSAPYYRQKLVGYMHTFSSIYPKNDINKTKFLEALQPLLSVYTDLEIFSAGQYSEDQKEELEKIIARIAFIYRKYLYYPENKTFLDVLAGCKQWNRQHDRNKFLSKLLLHLLTAGKKEELTDKDTMRYVVMYQTWMKIGETDEIKENIKNIFAKHVKPRKSIGATCVFQNYISLPADVKDPEAIELTSDFLKSLLVTNKTSFSLTRCLSNNEIIEKEPDLFIDASNHDDVQRKVRIKLAGMKCGDEEIPMAPDLEQIFRSKGGTYYPVRFQCDKSILRPLPRSRKNANAAQPHADERARNVADTSDTPQPSSSNASDLAMAQPSCSYSTMEAQEDSVIYDATSPISLIDSNTDSMSRSPSPSFNQHAPESQTDPSPILNSSHTPSASSFWNAFDSFNSTANNSRADLTYDQPSSSSKITSNAALSCARVKSVSSLDSLMCVINANARRESDNSSPVFKVNGEWPKGDPSVDVKLFDKNGNANHNAVQALPEEQEAAPHQQAAPRQQNHMEKVNWGASTSSSSALAQLPEQQVDPPKYRSIGQNFSVNSDNIIIDLDDEEDDASTSYAEDIGIQMDNVDTADVEVQSLGTEPTNKASSNELSSSTMIDALAPLIDLIDSDSMDSIASIVNGGTTVDHTNNVADTCKTSDAIVEQTNCVEASAISSPSAQNNSPRHSLPDERAISPSEFSNNDNHDPNRYLNDVQLAPLYNVPSDSAVILDFAQSTPIAQKNVPEKIPAVAVSVATQIPQEFNAIIERVIAPSNNESGNNDVDSNAPNLITDTSEISNATARLSLLDNSELRDDDMDIDYECTNRVVSIDTRDGPISRSNGSIQNEYVHRIINMSDSDLENAMMPPVSISNQRNTPDTHMSQDIFMPRNARPNVPSFMQSSLLAVPHTIYSSPGTVSAPSAFSPVFTNANPMQSMIESPVFHSNDQMATAHPTSGPSTGTPTRYRPYVSSTPIHAENARRQLQSNNTLRLIGCTINDPSRISIAQQSPRIVHSMPFPTAIKTTGRSIVKVLEKNVAQPLRNAVNLNAPRAIGLSYPIGSIKLVNPGTSPNNVVHRIPTRIIPNVVVASQATISSRTIDSSCPVDIPISVRILNPAATQNVVQQLIQPLQPTAIVPHVSTSSNSNDVEGQSIQPQRTTAIISNDSIASDSGTPDQPGKRKRGRPRKHPLPLDAAGNPIQPEPKPKRQRTEPQIKFSMQLRTVDGRGNLVRDPNRKYVTHRVRVQKKDKPLLTARRNTRLISERVRNILYNKNGPKKIHYEEERTIKFKMTYVVEDPIHAEPKERVANTKSKGTRSNGRRTNAQSNGRRSNVQLNGSQMNASSHEWETTARLNGLNFSANSTVPASKPRPQLIPGTNILKRCAYIRNSGESNTAKVFYDYRTRVQGRPPTPQELSTQGQQPTQTRKIQQQRRQSQYQGEMHFKSVNNVAATENLAFIQERRRRYSRMFINREVQRRKSKIYDKMQRARSEENDAELGLQLDEDEHVTQDYVHKEPESNEAMAKRAKDLAVQTYVNEILDGSEPMPSTSAYSSHLTDAIPLTSANIANHAHAVNMATNRSIDIDIFDRTMHHVERNPQSGSLGELHGLAFTGSDISLMDIQYDNNDLLVFETHNLSTVAETTETELTIELTTTDQDSAVEDNDDSTRKSKRSRKRPKIFDL